MSYKPAKRQRRCKRCRDLFMSDPRSKGHQRYCSQKACQDFRQNKNRDDWYRKNPDALEYRQSQTRAWFKAHPQYSTLRRTEYPCLARDNRTKTRRRMQTIRQKQLFDKTKSILTQDVGINRDKCFLMKGRGWILARLTKRSRLKRTFLWCKKEIIDQSQLHQIAGFAKYRLSDRCTERIPP